MAEEQFLLKDLFDPESVGALADGVAAAWDGFERTEFLEAVFDDAWPGLELKQRMRHIATVLRSVLPGGYRDQLQILLSAAAHTPPGFPAMAFSDFVEAFGTDDWAASVPALERFTTLVSAEFAIRPFIASDPERTLAKMVEWARHSDPAVRRLASEGSRPRLPWGMRLKQLVEDPSPVLPILELLRDDPDEVVRRSVANNLNDISKDHAPIVIDVLRGWSETPSANTAALTKHALRTLLKRGDRDALELMGFRPDPAVTSRGLSVEPDVVRIGATAQMQFELTASGDEPQHLMVDYAIHYVKANGATAPKVFKLKTLVLEPGETVVIRRKLTFKQMSTRTHRPGTHRVEVMANGTSLGSVSFELVDNPPPG